MQGVPYTTLQGPTGSNQLPTTILIDSYLHNLLTHSHKLKTIQILAS